MGKKAINNELSIFYGGRNKNRCSKFTKYLFFPTSQLDVKVYFLQHINTMSINKKYEN